jgi:hypothetical protein
MTPQYVQKTREVRFVHTAVSDLQPAWIRQMFTRSDVAKSHSQYRQRHASLAWTCLESASICAACTASMRYGPMQRVGN